MNKNLLDEELEAEESKYWDDPTKYELGILYNNLKDIEEPDEFEMDEIKRSHQHLKAYSAESQEINL